MVVGVIGVLRLHPDLDEGVAQLPAIVGEGEAVGVRSCGPSRRGSPSPSCSSGAMIRRSAEAAPLVLGDDAVEAPQVVHGEVGARDGVGPLGRRDAADPAQRSARSPRCRRCAPPRGGGPTTCSGTPSSMDAARVEGRVYLRRRSRAFASRPEKMSKFVLLELLLDSGERGAPTCARAFVVEGELLAAVPVGVEEVGVDRPHPGRWKFHMSFTPAWGSPSQSISSRGKGRTR